MLVSQPLDDAQNSWEAYYKQESQNVKPRYGCVLSPNANDVKDKYGTSILPIDERQCRGKTNPTHHWIEFPSHGKPVPEVLLHDFSRFFFHIFLNLFCF